MRRIVLIFCLAALPLPVLAQSIEGPAVVIDGDTLKISQTTIRLHAIDAPEGNQICKRNSGAPYACGPLAHNALKMIIGSSNVTCHPRNRDRYGRVVARCFANDLDVAQVMVMAGAAFAYRRYGHDYVEAEAFARRHARGFWNGRFDYPWDWRKANK